ncbi:MAG: hypothetical protein AAF609_12155 [Cyanobacteria bacterium P01_C01_bin.120]
MADENLELPAEIDFSKGYLKLPFGQDQFSKFIASLLGKPQTISKTFEGEFSFDLNSIRNIFHVIEQRLSQQSEAYMVQFSGTITFNDNSTVTLDGIDSFATYNEFRPIFPVKLSLDWIYMVQFKDKDFPEKQEIILEVSTTAGKYTNEFYLGGYINYGNKIDIRIFHTNRIWGTDLLLAIGGYVESLIEQGNHRSRNFLSKYYEAVGWLSAILLFLGFALGGYIAMTSASSNTVAEINQITTNAETVTTAISGAIETIFRDQSKLFLLINLYSIASVFLSIFFGFIVSGIVHVEKTAFILLTELSYRNKKKVVDQKNKRLLAFLFSIAIGILINIISSYIFGFLTSI